MADADVSTEAGEETVPTPPTTQNTDDVDSVPSEDTISDISVATPKSIKCDDCEKLFKDVNEAEFHSVKTGHQNFSESTDAIQPLTDEQKQEQRKKLEERITQRRQERSEREKAEQVEREKQRRVQGKDMTALKQRLQYEEMKKLADERKKEKMADRALRQKIKEQIQQDRIDRQARVDAEQGRSNGVQVTPNSTPQAPPEAKQAVPVKKEYESCRLQLRLPDGGVLTQTFSVSEQLAAVRLYVQQNWPEGWSSITDVFAHLKRYHIGETGAFKLMTTFPKVVFSDDQLLTPIKNLGLAPSSVIVVSRK